MKKKFALFPFIFAAAAFLPACAANSVPFDGHPESVAEDDDVFYVACIGKTMTPTAKDGDGFIATMNARGKILSPNAFPNVRLDAPKGALVEDGVLYVADVDRVVGISVRAGIVVRTFDFSKENTKFLNDLAEKDGFLYVSATDVGKIFRIDLRGGAYSELKTTEPLDAPNGLAIEDGVLYVAEYATGADGAPAGKIKALPLGGAAGTPVPVSVVRDVPGLYDGIAVEEEEDLFGRESDWLYFSDWAANGSPGAVKKMNLRTREVKDAVSVPVNGPADFIVEDGKIYLPAMLDKKVVVE